MNNKNYNPAKIELALNDALTAAGVLPAANIFPGRRPDVDSGMNEFIVVTAPTEVIDFNAYGKSISTVEVYVRKMANGRKDGQRMTELFDSIFNTLPIITPEYDFEIMGTLSETDNLGFDITIITLYTLTKITN